MGTIWIKGDNAQTLRGQLDQGDWEGNHSDCSFEIEATQEEVDRYRALAVTAGAGTDLYYLQVARTIEENM